MTRPHRRDKGLVGASVITAVRMEKSLAQRVGEAARARAEGDVAQLVRYLIRVGLGYSHDVANAREAAGGFTYNGISGLKMEAEIEEPLERYASELGCGRFCAVRHLVRMGLGMKAEESKRREAVFAEIASARRTMAEEID